MYSTLQILSVTPFRIAITRAYPGQGSLDQHSESKFLSPTLSLSALCDLLPGDLLTESPKGLATAGSAGPVISSQCSGRTSGSRAFLGWLGPHTGVFSPNRFQPMGRDMVENCILIRENKTLIS